HSTCRRLPNRFATAEPCVLGYLNCTGLHSPCQHRLSHGRRCPIPPRFARGERIAMYPFDVPQPSTGGRAPVGEMPPLWVLNASDLTFAWEECPCCFYHLKRHGIRRPKIPFPAFFSHVDSCMKACFQDGRVEALAPALPGGVIAHAGEWVESVPIHLDGR